MPRPKVNIAKPWWTTTDKNKWFVQVIINYKRQFIHSDGTVHDLAKYDGLSGPDTTAWYPTRQAAREAVKLWRQNKNKVVIRLGENHITLEKSDEQGCIGSVTTDLIDMDQDDQSQWRVAIDTMLSVVLAHAEAGVDVASPAYVQGLEVALDFVVNMFGDD